MNLFKIAYFSMVRRAKLMFTEADRPLTGERVNYGQYIDPFSEITVVLTVWKRSYLNEQLSAILNQTKKCGQIWIIQYEENIDISDVLDKYPFITYIKSGHNLKYFGRFSLARFITTKFAWIIDDDVIPGQNWLENAFLRSIKKDIIVSVAGRRIPQNTYHLGGRKDMHIYFFGDSMPGYNFNFCAEETEVDFGCNGWFFRVELIKTFWQIPPITLSMGEDMHLSAICKQRLGIVTVVLKQQTKEESGNLKIEYGRDSFASWTKAGFYEKRAEVLHYLIDEIGWRPMFWIN